MGAMDRPVLVLNANYAPLHVCTTRRALVLVLAEKATIILNGRGMIRTPSTAFPLPSIIRLGQMVSRPQPRVRLSKQELFRRDNHSCQYCGRQDAVLTIDHVIPRRLGGGHTWSNLVTACAACNRKKGGRSAPEAGMPLLRTPSEPPATANYLYRRYLPVNQDWVPFIDGW